MDVSILSPILQYSSLEQTQEMQEMQESRGGVRSSGPSSTEPRGRVQCATLQLSPGHLSETLT